MLQVANLVDTKWCKKPWKMIGGLTYGYSSESTQRELSNEYQHDRVLMVYENLCILVLWTIVALASEGLIDMLLFPFQLQHLVPISKVLLLTLQYFQMVSYQNGARWRPTCGPWWSLSCERPCHVVYSEDCLTFATPHFPREYCNPRLQSKIIRSSWHTF